MKRGILALLLLLMIYNVNAQDIVDAGLKPGNVFYGMERSIERMQLSISGQGIPRAKLHLLFAEERLAEAKELVDENKNDKIVELALEYEDNIARANIELDKARTISLDVSDIVRQMEISTDKHVAVLELILAKVPDSAKPGIQRALDNAKSKSAQLKEQNKKAGIDIIGADVILTQEELRQKQEELRQREEELNKKEDELKGGGLTIITGLAPAGENDRVLKSRMGIIFLIMIIGTYLYFYYITKKRHKELIKKKK